MRKGRALWRPALSLGPLERPGWLLEGGHDLVVDEAELAVDGWDALPFAGGEGLHQAGVEGPPVLARALGARAEVLDRVLVGGTRVAERVVHAVGELAGGLERLRPAHRADLDGQVLLDGTGEGEQAL